MATANAVEEITNVRQLAGVDPASLLVLEFDSVNVDLRDAFEERFSAWVVDEQKSRADGEDRYRLLVQFLDAQATLAFQQELARYRDNTGQAAVLPPGLRQRFFDGLQRVGAPSREERLGPRLRAEGFPSDDSFYLDVDLWHPGDDGWRRILEEVRRVCSAYGGSVMEHVRTSSLLLAKIRATRDLAEILLDLDLVARLDLPARIRAEHTEMFRDLNPPPADALPLPDDPLVCVVDSGVVPGHPLLSGWVVEERDFDTGEGTPVDLNGHGTAVAGQVVYGDVASCIARNLWQPKVRICSAKVLRNDPNALDPAWSSAVFPERHRVEVTIEDAIRHFHQERGCRIFNLSLGDETEVYDGARQFPWAEKLDELARELDIVIVVSAGNRAMPNIPERVHNVEQMQQAIRNSLLEADQRVCNPATSALAMTVGAIARSDVTDTAAIGGRVMSAFAAAPEGAPSPFTRTGFGYSVDSSKHGIKPDIVHFGGNFGIQTLAGGDPRWLRNSLVLGEPTIQREVDGRYVGTNAGTSFAAPHVAHAAAVASVGLEAALGWPPTANLIRALVASSARAPDCPAGWLGTEQDALRLIGYGLCDEASVPWSRDNRVVLVAEDSVQEDHLHVYRVVVPEVFQRSAGQRGIRVALGFDPPVRASRREYLSRTMWFEVLKGLTNEEVGQYRARYDRGEQPQIRPSAFVLLRPTKSQTQWSTLQVRSYTWKRASDLPVATGDTEAALHVVVGCQRRFAHGMDPSQRYGLVVQFWHEGEHVDLYQQLRTRIRVPAVRIRV